MSHVLLPALPKAWRFGKITGLHTRSGKTLDIEWEDGNVLSKPHISPIENPTFLRLRTSHFSDLG